MTGLCLATQIQHTNRAYWGEIDGNRHTLELRLEFDATNLTSGISAGTIDLYYCGWDDAEYVGESTRFIWGSGHPLRVCMQPNRLN